MFDLIDSNDINAIQLILNYGFNINYKYRGVTPVEYASYRKRFIIVRMMLGLPINNDSDCSICLDDITRSDLYLTRCNHSFHKDCIEEWGISKNCPNCRQ